VLTEVGLRGAVVIVTGAGSGIGAATARQLGTVGARVVLVGRREALLTDVAAEIAEGGGDALSVTADLADQASPRRIVDACLNHYNRLDGLPVAGRPGPAGADRRPGGGGDLDYAAAQPARVVHDRRGHPAGRRPGH
jgi:short chain dehydrogenase